MIDYISNFVYIPTRCVPEDTTPSELEGIADQEKVTFRRLMQFPVDLSDYPAELKRSLTHQRKDMYAHFLNRVTYPHARRLLVPALGAVRGAGLAIVTDAEYGLFKEPLVQLACQALWEAGLGQDERVIDAVRKLPDLYDSKKLEKYLINVAQNETSRFFPTSLT